VDELLLVRGVTPDLFYGTPATDTDPARPGFKDIFTTMTSGSVNVNTASAIVLQTVLGLDDVQLQAVMQRRDGPDGIPGTDDDMPFHTIQEFTAIVGNLNAAALTGVQGSATVNSTFFTVKSTGQVAGVKHTIFATFKRDNGNLETVMWRQMREGS